MRNPRQIVREPGRRTWTWRIPAVGEVGDEVSGASGPGGVVRLVPGRVVTSADAGAEWEFSGVRGDDSVADRLRGCADLGAREVGRLVDVTRTCLAPTSPAVLAPHDPPDLHSGSSSDDTVGGAAAAARLREQFLDACVRTGLEHADAVAAAAAAVPDRDRIRVDRDEQHAVSLGRVVPVDDGEIDVLTTGPPGPADLSWARVHAEAHLTAALFTAAGKPGAESLASFERAVVDTVPTTVPAHHDLVLLFLISHAVRVAVVHGFHPSTVGLELAVIRRWSADHAAAPV